MDEFSNTSPLEAENWIPEKPTERKEVEDQEQVKVSSSIGVIKEILDWFEKQTEGYKKNEAIAGVTVNTPADDVKSAVLLAHGMSAQFESKAAEFKRDFAKYLKEGPIEKV